MVGVCAVVKVSDGVVDGRSRRADEHGLGAAARDRGRAGAAGQPATAESFAAAAEHAADGTNPPADLQREHRVQAAPGARADPARAHGRRRQRRIASDGSAMSLAELQDGRRRERRAARRRDTWPIGRWRCRSTWRLDARAAAAAGGRGRRRQDRGRAGAGGGDRRAADPAAVPRGHRPAPRRLRLGLLAPAAGAAGGRGRRRRGRAVRPPVPAAPAAAGGARIRSDAAGRAADRRGRPRRRRVRGVPAGVPVGLRGHDPRARHDRRRAAADRGADLQPHARAARRAQAPLPVPLDRLPVARARARDRRARGCRRCPSGSPRGSSAPWRGCASRATCTSSRASARRSSGRRRCWRSATRPSLEETLGTALKVHEDVQRVLARKVLEGV